MDKDRKIIIIVCAVLLILFDLLLGVGGSLIEDAINYKKMEKRSEENWAATERVIEEHFGSDIFTSDEVGTFEAEIDNLKEVILCKVIEETENGENTVRMMLISLGIYDFGIGSHLTCDYNVSFIVTETGEIKNKKIGDMTLKNIDNGVETNGKITSGRVNYNEKTFAWLFGGRLYGYAPNLSYDEAKKFFKKDKQSWSMKDDEEAFLKMGYDKAYGMKQKKTNSLFSYRIDLRVEDPASDFSASASFDFARKDKILGHGELEKIISKNAEN